MAWVTPKTDWKESYSETGVYEGDWFNAEDYARIKGNLEYLNDRATEIYSPSSTFPDIPNIDVTSFAYASTIDALERALDDLTTGDRLNPGVPPTKHWGGNDLAPRAEDLNRIESACLLLYELMGKVTAVRVKLSFQMGGSQF